MGPPRLKTERLLLREFRPEDLAPDLEQAQDPEVQRFLGGVRSEYDAFRTVATHAGHWALRGFGQWAVQRRSDGRFVGRVGLWEPPGWPGPEVGWRLGREAWGQGYATEAARAAIGWAWTALDLTQLSSMILPENTASQRVAQRLGHVNAGPCELPVGTCDRWVLDRPPGDGHWALRPAGPDDAPRVGEQLREAMARFRDISPPGWTPPAPTDDELRDALARPAVRALVAEPGGVLAGHTLWRPSVDGPTGPDDPDGAYLANIYVEPGWWGSALARRLMAHAADDARAAGFVRMHLVTPAAQGRARRFYEREGWHAPGPPADDERFGMPTITYTREL
jgi:RimJ/RimL family protein N-acetyltransferase/ribosomal protein S18 acetylase RimI-like enzyme